MNHYELSRQYWDFAFENPEKVKPTHTAMYFFAIEHCNRLGWKSKFGLPTSMVIEATGLKSYNTYKKHFDDLVSWGFFKVIEYSRNQYSSNIIALSKFDKALDKALDKAITNHKNKCFVKKSESTSESTVQSTSESTGSIDKQDNIEPYNILPSAQKNDQFSIPLAHIHFKPTEQQLNSFGMFLKWIDENTPEIAKMKKPITIVEYLKLIGEYHNKEGIKTKGVSKQKIMDHLRSIENNTTYLKKYRSPYLCVLAWEKNSRKGLNLAV